MVGLVFLVLGVIILAVCGVFIFGGGPPMF
jgi:hypothetical protein